MAIEDAAPRTESIDPCLNADERYQVAVACNSADSARQNSFTQSDQQDAIPGSKPRMTGLAWTISGFAIPIRDRETCWPRSDFLSFAISNSWKCLFRCANCFVEPESEELYPGLLRSKAFFRARPEFLRSS